MLITDIEQIDRMVRQRNTGNDTIIGITYEEYTFLKKHRRQ